MQINIDYGFQDMSPVNFSIFFTRLEKKQLF